MYIYMHILKCVFQYLRTLNISCIVYNYIIEFINIVSAKYYFKSKHYLGVKRLLFFHDVLNGNYFTMGGNRNTVKGNQTIIFDSQINTGKDQNSSIF